MEEGRESFPSIRSGRKSLERERIGRIPTPIVQSHSRLSKVPIGFLGPIGSLPHGSEIGVKHIILVMLFYLCRL
jgi:hypothetical protein